MTGDHCLCLDKILIKFLKFITSHNSSQQSENSLVPFEEPEISGSITYKSLQNVLSFGINLISQ